MQVGVGVNLVWPVGGLIAIVASVLFASRVVRWRTLFRWLPAPLWCYLLPSLAVTLGWLPGGHPAIGALAAGLLPFALVLLLLGADVPALLRVGARAVLVSVIGAAGIAAGVAAGTWLLRAHLPPEAWKGSGALAATWTGGSLNLLSMRAILDVPDQIFTPLILVDALIAYAWMALLVAASGSQQMVNRWLGARPMVFETPRTAVPTAPTRSTATALVVCVLLALIVGTAAQWAATRLPMTPLISSAVGWTVLLVTTGALGLSFIPQVRRTGASAGVIGYPCLYLVLAATGAQADLTALRAAPVWLAVGCVAVVVHGGVLIAAGRLLRIPVGLLATASQANLGGFISGPLVGAVYHPSLAAVGLLLAMAGSALGTYCGLAAAFFTRRLLGG